jgi:hypothetical protein
MAALTLLAAAGWASPAHVRAADAQPAAEAYMVVDCLLPGQVRKLGRSQTFLTPRRPMRTSAINCEIRGGEYVAADRATFESSLGVWLPSAKEGDAKAQAYVGHIYADGFGREPDFVQAAAWYGKAADQGYAQAMIDLGQLYERGLGVSKDTAKAVALYRKATGLPPGQFAPSEAMERLNAKYETARSDAEGLSRELAAARAELAQQQAALARAQDQLKSAGANRSQAAQASAAKASADVLALQRQLAAKSAELEAAKAQSTQLASDLEKTRAAADKGRPLETQLKTAQAQQADVVRQRDALQAQVASLRTQLPDQQGKVAFLEADAAQARKVAADANARLSQTLVSLKTREGELAALKAQLAEQQAQAAAHAGDQAAAARLRDAQAGYDRMARDLEQTRSEAAQRQAEIAAADRAGQARTAELAKAKSDVLAAQTQLTKAQSALESRDAELKLASVKLTDAEGRAAQMQREYQAAQQHSTDLAAQVAALQQQMAQSRQGGADSARELAAMKTRLDAREAKVKELEAKLAVTYRSAPITPVSAPAQPSRLSASSKFGFNQSFALLIGESNYADPRLPKLATPASDVTQLSELLKTRYGFNTIVLLDKSRTEILRQLDLLAQKLTENDTLLIYYAGHGGMEKVRNGSDRGYWLPVDAELGSSAGQISNQEITYQVARMAARKVLIVADSCYSGLLTETVSRAQRPTDAVENSTDYLIGMAHKQSRNVLTSGRLEPVLDGGGAGNHSVFASALINVLKSNNDVITSDEIYGRLVGRVMASATGVLLREKDTPNPQQPTYSALDSGGHIYGDFVFVPHAPA